MAARFKKTGLLLLAISFFVLKVNSQAPGYMGKKLVAGYGLYGNPAFGNITVGYSDNPINILHEFFLEYATGKKFMLGVSARLYRYNYLNVELVNASHSNSSTFRQIDDSPSGSYMIKGRNYQLYGKFFKAKYLAPWGKYFLLGLALNRYETTYDPDKMEILVENRVYSPAVSEYIYQKSYVNDFGPTTQTYQKIDIFFGNGNSRILGNKIVLDYGYTINAIAMARMFSGVLDVYEETYPEDYIEDTSLRRISAINRFNFYFKLGYLF